MLKLTKAALSSLNGGKLEAQFQERLLEALIVFSEPGAWQQSSGRIVVGVQVAIEIAYNPSNHDILVISACDLKMPKRQKAAAGMYLSKDDHGQMIFEVMETEQEQMPLPLFEQSHPATQASTPAPEPVKPPLAPVREISSSRKAGE